MLQLNVEGTEASQEWPGEGSQELKTIPSPLPLGLHNSRMNAHSTEENRIKIKQLLLPAATPSLLLHS